MVGIAIAAATGMLIASSRLLSPSLLFFLALFSILLALYFRNAKHSTSLVFISVLFSSTCRFLTAQPDLAPDSINQMDLAADQSVQLVGRVSGFPEFYSYNSGARGIWIFPAEVGAVQISKDWKTASGAVDVKIKSAPPQLDLTYGDRVQVAGVSERNRFPGANPWSVITQETGFQCLELSGRWSPVVWGRAWRNAVAPHLESGLENFPVQESVLKALVLGFRKEMPPEISGIFRRTGALHIFAISGLHVGIVGFLLALVLKTLGVPRDKFGLLLIPLLALYVISTGMKSSAIRALLMAAVFMLAPLFRRKPDIPTSVSIAALILLFFQPLEILSAGFIFSFTVVAFLVMVYSVVPRHWMQGPRIKVYCTSLVITSLAAGLASIPLAALFFGTFSPIAFVGNLIVVPLTFCIVLCGWLSILVPVAAGIFNQAAVVFIDLLLGSVQWLDKIPGSSWAVEPPPLFAVLLWFGSLIALLTWCRLPRQRWLAVGGAAVALLLAVLG